VRGDIETKEDKYISAKTSVASDADLTRHDITMLVTRLEDLSIRLDIDAPYNHLHEDLLNSSESHFDFSPTTPLYIH